MEATENKALQALLKEFKKGNRVTKGYEARYSNGMSMEAIHSNDGRNCGEKIGEVKIYDCPSYFIYRDNEHIFSIQAYNNLIIVMGDSNQSEPLNTWTEAFAVGLEYYKKGY